jgi:hypothetical protein
LPLGCIRIADRSLYFVGEEPTRRAAAALVGEYQESAYSFFAICRVLGLDLTKPPSTPDQLDWVIEFKGKESFAVA